MTNRSGKCDVNRLMRRVEKTDDCWIWFGAVSNSGYGQIGDEGRTRSVHRVAYELFNGPIPEGAVIDHTCHNRDRHCKGKCPHRLCVNPDHLEAVTELTNIARATHAARWAS